MDAIRRFAQSRRSPSGLWKLENSYDTFTVRPQDTNTFETLVSTLASEVKGTTPRIPLWRALKDFNGDGTGPFVIRFSTDFNITRVSKNMTPRRKDTFVRYLLQHVFGDDEVQMTAINSGSIVILPYYHMVLVMGIRCRTAQDCSNLLQRVIDRWPAADFKTSASMAITTEIPTFLPWFKSNPSSYEEMHMTYEIAPRLRNRPYLQDNEIPLSSGTSPTSDFISALHMIRIDIHWAMVDLRLYSNPRPLANERLEHAVAAVDQLIQDLIASEQ